MFCILQRKTTPKSELKCVNCHKHPKIFHNDAAQREFEEISQICGACWEVITLEPDAYDEAIERAKTILKMQDREYYYHPRGWKCLTCNMVFQPHNFGNEICRC